MKVVLLAGGLGTRLSEETVLRPKPMVEIGGMPILWHIMKIYSAHGFNDFVVCLGYKGYVIKEYFANYFLHKSDVTIDLSDNSIKVHDSQAEPWKITLVDTGNESMTGGRIKRIQPHIGSETFMFTYGDGVSDVDIKALVEHHKNSGKKCTVTSVQPSGRFGAINLNADDSVHSFMEKPKGDGAWINGGFFVCEPSVFDYITGDSSIWEREPMEKIAEEGEMTAFKHEGFWKPMDTIRDKHELEEDWTKNKAKWKIW
ncbi:glucose-1-phosphate cytidylyltransferase [Mucilaginibacter gossypii]|uniref:glucose-1-phosphate cytidylyltransferase n=1 Tax=Mucilaginibacter gossypii TaxID=551996 RepID=UPI000DCBAFC7|nr:MULTISPECIES: glucose-1-phosphate cytidylyltransferase [Mucilaginibacter]QTE40261.1 glucose-1-phosphate cytidylyltransferase [Mucilaginibacter gossypii]RAV57544.1 glucose-1-phosphate cytidylyltransferase [Mucilaginibacter rubeus]